jgi:hypothetical protein
MLESAPLRACSKSSPKSVLPLASSTSNTMFTRVEAEPEHGISLISSLTCMLGGSVSEEGGGTGTPAGGDGGRVASLPSIPTLIGIDIDIDMDRDIKTLPSEKES